MRDRQNDSLRRQMLDATMMGSMGTPAQWIQHEMRFHECIVQAAKNEVMTTVMEMLSRMLHVDGEPQRNRAAPD